MARPNRTGRHVDRPWRSAACAWIHAASTSGKGARLITTRENPWSDEDCDRRVSGLVYGVGMRDAASLSMAIVVAVVAGSIVCAGHTVPSGGGLGAPALGEQAG